MWCVSVFEPAGRYHARGYHARRCRVEQRIVQCVAAEIQLAKIQSSSMTSCCGTPGVSGCLATSQGLYMAALCYVRASSCGCLVNKSANHKSKTLLYTIRVQVRIVTVALWL